MAAPNFTSVTAIYGKTAVMGITTTPTAILSNGGSSGKALKVTSLYVSNVGAAEKHVTVDHYRSSTATRIAYQVVVPVNATLVAIDREGPLYLEEGDDLRLAAETDSFLEAVASYEEIA